MPIDLERTKWGVSENGADLFGYLRFATEIQGRPTILSQHVTNEIEPTMGLRHSNLSKFAAKATVGGDCFVCDNMAITGEIAFNYKHTFGNVNSLSHLIGHGLVKYLDKIPELGKMVTALKERYITNERLSDTYLRAARTKLLPWSHIGMVDKFWEEPTHPEFAKRHDGWRLYNAFNTVAKKYNPTRQIEMVSKDKKGEIPPLEMNHAMEWGHILEDVIAKKYADDNNYHFDLYGLPLNNKSPYVGFPDDKDGVLYKPRIVRGGEYQSDVPSWAYAHPDGFVQLGDPDTALAILPSSMVFYCYRHRSLEISWVSTPSSHVLRSYASP